MPQCLFYAGQILTKSSQNKFALFAAGQLGAEQIEDEWVRRLANSRDCDIRSLIFQAAQPSTMYKRARVLPYGGAAEFSDSLAG